MNSRDLRHIATTLTCLVATAALASGCSSGGAKHPTLNGVPPGALSSPQPAACGQLSDLMGAEQSTIRDLQSGKVSDEVAEGTITGVDGQLAQASEHAGRASIIGITIQQLVSANGTFAVALNQSVPVANLSELIGTIQQDITNVKNNCHN